ncbi:MAG: adenylate/guanylate cyclase domain-containing protein [Bacteroidota bacterium]
MQKLVRWWFRWLVLFIPLCGTLSLVAQNGLITLDKDIPRLNIPDSLIYVQIADDSLPPLEGVWTRFNQDIAERLEVKSAVWVRLWVSSVDEDTTVWWVEIERNDLIDAYQKSANGWMHQRTGATIPATNKIRNSGYKENALFKLPPQDSSLLYFRIETLEKAKPVVAFRFKENNAFEYDFLAFIGNIIGGTGIFMGILTIMMLYHLMLFFSTREIAYLYYTLYVLAVDLVIFWDGVVGPFGIFPISLLNASYTLSWITGLISVFYYLFAQAYLKTKAQMPRWHRWIYYLIILKLVLLVGGTAYRLISQIPETTVVIRNIIFLVDVPFLLAFSIALINNQIRGRTYFIIGSILVFVIGFLAIGFRKYMPVEPFLIFLLCFLGHILVYSLGLGRQIREDQQAKLKAQAALNEELSKINKATERFVPYEFLRSLGRDSVLDVKLGDGVEKEVSVLFSDIRSYATLSESMTPRENFEFLNTYLGKVGPVIQTHDGFVNQYYGDGVMALFQNQVMDAISAAIEMQQAVQNYNQERSIQELPPIQIGIGLHTGSLMMGIMGDNVRMEAGVVSDTVNTAARMEGLTKLYGASLVLSGASVANIVPEARYLYPMRFLGKVMVKGRQQAMDIYDCFAADAPEILAQKTKYLKPFEQALAHYMAGEFTESQRQFGAILSQWDGDLAAKRLFERSAELSQQKDLTDWDGVDRMLTK